MTFNSQLKDTVVTNDLEYDEKNKQISSLTFPRSLYKSQEKIILASLNKSLCPRCLIEYIKEQNNLLSFLDYTQ